MQQLPDALAPLAAYNQFILYKLVPDGPKTKKLPIDPRTLQVMVKGQNWMDDPLAWTDANNAINLAKLCGVDYGVGFLLTKNDPFYFCDIDSCLQPDNGTWSPLAQDLMARLPGAAVEVSQSGRGLHIIGTGITAEHSCKNQALDIELYTERRVISLTGTSIIGNAATNNAATGGALVDLYFPPKTTARGDEWKTEALPEWNGPTDNDQLIEKMVATQSASAAFGNRASFKELWEGTTDALSDYFPDPSGDRLYDESSADAALAQHLAFWTGCNHQRMLDLMWLSGLVRDKWTGHEKYLSMTITRAVSLQTNVYTAGGVADQVLKLKGTPKQIAFANTIIEKYNDDRIATLGGPALNAKFWIENQDKSVDELIALTTPIESATNPMGNIEDGPEITAGYQFLGVTQQLEHFKGCVYIQKMHRVLTPTGALLRSEQFNATYGGYSFQMESDSGGKAAKKAFEAFTESQAIRYPKADSMCFRPDLPHGELIRQEGETLANTYLDIETPSMPGDVSPFTEHLIKVLPIEHDRAILLAYMAACIQHKGIKFQWTPLIQGMEGNGKTLFSRCVAAAVGKRYTHYPKADDIDNKFNAWMLNKLFIGVEDIYVADHRREVIEALKPMITNDELEIQLKGVDQTTLPVCANFILNMNDKAGFKKTRNDRRFAMFYTAQQQDGDLERDGMNGSYFPNLYKWLKTQNGYAIVTNYLENYSIPDELNPATACHRAPITSSTEEAIEVSIGGVEQEILEAVEENRVGFMGGWISSVALEKLLHGLGASRKIPVNKRRDLLKTLGYDWHPGLNKGRTNSPIMIDDGKKPRLFLKIDHIASNLTDAWKISKAYEDAQGVMGATTAASAFGKPS